MLRGKELCESKINYDIKNIIKALNKSFGVFGINEVLSNIKIEIFKACCDSYNMPINKLNCDTIFEIIEKYEKRM